MDMILNWTCWDFYIDFEHCLDLETDMGKSPDDRYLMELIPTFLGMNRNCLVLGYISYGLAALRDLRAQVKHPVCPLVATCLLIVRCERQDLYL